MNYRIGKSTVVHSGSDWAYETLCGIKGENSPEDTEWYVTYTPPTCRRCKHHLDN